ncbi:nad dependent epimerase [Fusarium albosuccineum]|uniref:Nad dependent epimerase n=1 Tax=Fusarium albosuccineum TaxID=1237068 RepID=A0A8H4PID6_9HYPO|nr:nad dependent epimerase [Fusarium albosuccineum]
MLVLIAGITGSLGQRLASNAISRGLSSRGLGRDPSKLPAAITEKLESFVKSTSYYDISALDQAVKGVDGIICCYSPGPVLDLDANLLLLRAAERAGVKVFIASSWNNDWTKLKFGEFIHYDPYIAFEQQAAMTSAIRPVYLFTGTFSDLLLTPYGPGMFASDNGKAQLKYWADGNLRKWSWSAQDDVAAWTIEILINGKGVQEGKGGSFRFRSGEVTIDSLADAYKRVTGKEIEVVKVGEVEDLERQVGRLSDQNGRDNHWAYLAESVSLIGSKGGWEMKAADVTVLDHVKKPRTLDECLKEHLNAD